MLGSAQAQPAHVCDCLDISCDPFMEYNILIYIFQRGQFVNNMVNVWDWI